MENNYAEETQFLSDKAAEKRRFRELSTKETKKGKCHTDSDKKAANVDWYVWYVSLKFPLQI